MKIKDLEERLNVGIPCYNQAFINLQNFTLSCYLKGHGDYVIAKERELRFESKRLIEDTFGIEDSLCNDGLYHYLSTGADTLYSNSRFGFGKVSKLCSMYYPSTEEPLCNINSYNVNDVVEEKNSDRLRKLYKIKDELLRYDFSDIEDDYFLYINEDKAYKRVLEQYCTNILYLINNKDLINAQKYYFVLLSNLINNGNIELNINGSNERLLDFVKTLKNKYSFKTDYLLREGFLGKSMNENTNIINSIINKENISLKSEICSSGESDTPKAPALTKSKRIITLDEQEKILKEVNDRRMFYLNLNPICEITSGKNFRKYGAFIYPNGMIVADRLYNINSLNTLKSNAIYKFTSINFEKLKDLTKSELVGNKIYHTDTWKKRTREYITQYTDDEMKEQAKELVKKLKK